MITKVNKENELLYNKALEVYKNAYVPYSKFSVGAAILLDDGKIVTGCNVENASYGLTMCAERNALFTVYGLGYRKENIKKILITGNTSRPISPCGACRQVISELANKDTQIILTNLNSDMVVFKVSELLPYGFSEDDLNE